MLSIAILVAMQVPQVTLQQSVNTLTESCKIKRGRYANASVIIKGNDLTIDFGGAELRGVSNDNLDKATGIGITIADSNNVTIKNARVYGFKVNLSAVNCTNLQISDCDLSYSGAQRIADGEAPINEWLVLRDLNAWRAYGSGIWLENCSESRVSRCKTLGAQNGILLVNTDKTLMTENDCSFNSGWGIGLWNSSENEITWNHADFVNRPWGGGWGGDSSGVVVVNGSNKNMVVANSFTHGGDGFFLTDLVNGGYNEQTKTFNFKGSSNDNMIAYNDGSWSPNNAFEGTFSFRNSYFRNQAENSGYGFWLGFSSDSHLQYNDINYNRADGIAIEQGHGNWILNNAMRGNKNAAVHLWSGSGAHLKAQPSRNNVIGANIIRDSALAYSLEGSTQYWIEANQVRDAKILDDLKPETRHSGEFEGREWLQERANRAREIFLNRPKAWKFYREQMLPLGTQWLRADTFAPHDFRKDLVAWRRVDDRTLQLATIEKDWASLVKPPLTVDRLAETLTGKLADDAVGMLVPSNLVIIKGKQKQLIDVPLLLTSWHLRWYQFAKDKPALNDKAAWDALFKSPPLAEEVRTHLNADFSFKPPIAGIKPEYFAFEATTSIDLPAGTYALNTLSDDGLEVEVDGQKVIEAFREGAGTQNAVFSTRGGVSRFRVRFVQTSGHTYLRFSLQKTATPTKSKLKLLKR